MPSDRLPIVILPGIDGQADLRMPLAKAIKAQQRPAHVLGYDNAAPPAYADLVDSLLPRVSAGRVVLLGESYGGPAATLMAERLGDRVAGLILAVTFVAPPFPWPTAHVTRWFGTGLVPMPIAQRLLLNGERGDVRDALSKAVLSVPDRVLTARALAALASDLSPVLARLRCPVLSLVARNDRLILRHNARHITRVQPHTKTVMLEGPHMILETRPDAVAAAIETFVRPLDVKVAAE